MQHWKYSFIRTPLERPLMRLRHALGIVKVWQDPRLREIYREEGRIETILQKVLRPRMNCVDVGCHYGSMLSRFCSLAPKGAHTAFEAIPYKADFLRRKFPEVTVICMALADMAGHTDFYINQAQNGFSGLVRHGPGAFSKITVACGRLDEAALRGQKVDFLKIDVEGAELFVLRGARALLKRDRPTILFECGPSGPAAHGYTASDLYDLLTAQNYSIFLLRDALGNYGPIGKRAFEEALIFPFKAFNWLAIAQERVQEVLGASQKTTADHDAETAPRQMRSGALELGSYRANRGSRRRTTAVDTWRVEIAAESYRI